MFATWKVLLAVLGLAALSFFVMTSRYSAAPAPKVAAVQIEVVHVSAANFKQEVEDSKVPVIVDFYATWCGPCKLLRPNLEKIAAEYGGKIKVVKVDVDLSPDLARRYGINLYPTILTFKDGKVKETLIGYRSVDDLRSICDKLLK